MNTRFVAMAAAFSVLMALSACGGGGNETQTEITTTTTGQQLVDLKEALDAGAISEKEYEKERKKILDN